MDQIEIPKLPREEAFLKGVEYGVEFFILYGLLGFISVYEIMKSINASKKLSKNLKDLESMIKGDYTWNGTKKFVNPIKKKV